MSVPIRSNLDLGLAQLLSALVEVLGADPGTVTNGRVFYNSATNKFKVGVNGSWVAFYPDTTPLNSIVAPTASVGMNSQKITGLADAVGATDAVTKQQLDAVSAGLDPKQSVRVATTAAGTLASSFANGSTVDGVALVTGNRILIKNQTANTENGIYTVNASGAPTRSSDADTGLELTGGAFVFVEEGTANADTGWVATHNGTPVLGTDPVTFSKFSAAATGVQKVAADITGNGALTSFAVTHNLGTKDVQVEVWEFTTDLKTLVEVVRTDTNTVTINFATAPANAKVYRVVMIG